MRRVLYGTTALVAAGLAAHEASAASALKLGITGFYRNSIGGSFGNSPTTQHFGNGPLAQGVGITTSGLGNFDRQNVSMRQEIRVNFTGQTTLDNGITVGVLVGLNGENVAKSGSTTQVNRAYADFSGKFGLVRVGEATGALGTDCVGDPGNVTSNFGVNSPNESYSNVGYFQRRNQFLKTANVSNSGGGYHSTFGVAPMGSIGPATELKARATRSSTTRPPSAASPSASPSRRRAARALPAAASPMAPMSRPPRAAAATTSCRWAPTTPTTSAAGI